MKFFTTERLGPKRSKTPEGFLVTHDVPIARTGEQIYAPGETPIPPGRDGVIHVLREEDEVFRPETVASFEGKPTTNDHPTTDVVPGNYRDLACGHVMNVRRGEDGFKDHLLADLVWTCPDAIREIETDAKTEISCGYDCDWVEDTGRPGWGWQTNIIGNHVALVDRARCGGSCSIQDAHKQETANMAGAKPRGRKSIMDWFRRARDAKDDSELEKLAEQHEKEGEHLAAVDDVVPGEGEEHTHVHVHAAGEGHDDDGPSGAEWEAHKTEMDARHKAHDDRIAALEDKMRSKDEELHSEEELKHEFQEEAPAGTGDDGHKAKDSASLQMAYDDVLAGAEILVPGFIPRKAYDRAASPKATLDALCAMRKDALALAAASPEVQPIIFELNGRKVYDGASMTCAAARTLFRAAVLAKKQRNMAARDTRVQTRDAGNIPGTPKSLADLNRMNEDFYRSKGVN